MKTGILYERSETDEMGIKLTAKEMGIDLEYIPFRKISICLHDNGYRIRSVGKDYSSIVKDVAVVLNRTQSKNRRLLAAYLMEKLGKHVINPSQVEFLCYSKLRTLLQLWAARVRVPKTVYVPCDSLETTKDGGEIHNEVEIADLIQQELGIKEIVMKPDAGTHGKKVNLSRNRKELLMNIQETNPSIINPMGILAQELVQKWFYDLRIVVFKEKGKSPVCHPKALARAGFKDFRTNTFLGNLVFDTELPLHIRDLAVKCGKAIGRDNHGWLFAFDAMINVGENKTADDEYVKSELDKLATSFDVIRRVKADQTKRKDFPAWNSKLEEAFQNYKRSEPYEKVRRVIEESVERSKHEIVFHEANSCPEFWEQTRLIAGINLAVPLFKIAQSITESDH